MRSFQLPRRPSTDIAQPERYARRSAHAGMAMDNDSVCIGPGINEISDGPRVILVEVNIRWFALLDDVGEIQSEDRCKTGGDARRLRVRVRNRNADFALARHVALGVLPREHDKRRNPFLPLSHPFTTLPPLRRDGQVPTLTCHDRSAKVQRHCPGTRRNGKRYAVSSRSPRVASARPRSVLAGTLARIVSRR